MTPADAIISRRAVRAFRPIAVPRETIARILEVAARAPSGSNTQPWHVHALAGPVRDTICAEMLAAHDGGVQEEREYAYYPDPWFEPYLARRRKLGWDLYATLGIAKGDRAGTRAQHRRNFDFFGAPAALVITIDRRLNIGSWLDLGMFLQNVMVACRGEDLHSCPQAAIANRHSILRRHLPIPPEHIVVCAIAIGQEDPDAPENRLRADRAPVDEFCRFHGF